MNKKGLATGIVVLMIGLFIFAVISLFTMTLWNQFNDVIQSADNSSILPESKENIDELGAYMLWNDKIFVILFIVMLVAYLISSVTLPVDLPIFLILFFFVLVILTVLAMLLSNLWAVFIENPFLALSLDDLKFTDYFMRFLPMITFFTGLLGAVLFYSRSSSGGESQGGGNVRGFE